MIRYYSIILIILALLSFYLIYNTRSEIGITAFPLDDSWIHLTFARNIATGNGYSYNPGEHVSGSTAPLWTILLSFVFLFSNNFYTSVFLMGIFFTFLSCIMAILLAKTLSDDPPFLLFTSIAIALTPPLVWTSISGMEPPLFTFLILAGIYCHVRYRDVLGIKQYLSTFLFGLVVWARPECILIFPISLIDRIFLEWGKNKSGSTRALFNSFVLHSFLFCIIVLLWMIFNYHLSGYIFPTTFYAKQYFFQKLGILGLLKQGNFSELIPFLLKGLWQWDWSVFLQFSFSNLFLIFFFIPGIIELIIQAKSVESKHRSYIIPLLLLLQPMIVGLIAPAIGGGFQHNRYFTHLFPIFTLISSYGLFRIIQYITVIRQGNLTFISSSTLLDRYSHLRKENLKPEWLETKIYKGYTLVSLLIILFWGIITFSDEVVTYKLNVKNITEMQVHLANYIRMNTEPGSLIATNDIGALGFFSQRKIIDLVGLITPKIIPYYMKSGSRDDQALQYLLENPVDYLVIFPEWYPDLVKHKDIFQEIYRVTIKDNITCGADTMVVYKMIRGNNPGQVSKNKL